MLETFSQKGLKDHTTDQIVSLDRAPHCTWVWAFPLTFHCFSLPFTGFPLTFLCFSLPFTGFPLTYHCFSLAFHWLSLDVSLLFTGFSLAFP